MRMVSACAPRLRKRVVTIAAFVLVNMDCPQNEHADITVIVVKEKYAGPALAHGAERGFCRPALRGIRQQQAVMAAHAVTIQIAQKRALLHHAFQSQSLLRRRLR